MSNNRNLFYQLYSKPSDIQQSGYVCSSAIDEKQTSFDISGSEAQVTDSNGDTLSSISLSGIHVDELTQYNTETKILQPNSTYLLQGNEYGQAHKSFYFKINSVISNIHRYENYCNIGFDIAYHQKNKIQNVHVMSYDMRKTYGSFIKIVQTQLNKLKIPVTISIKQLDDENSSDSQIDYIEFMSSEEGYDYIIRNVILYPILPGDETANGETGEFYDSPFVGKDITSDVIMDFIMQICPKFVGEPIIFDIAKRQKTYVVQCELYKVFLQLCDIITDDFNTFTYEFNIIKSQFLSCFDQLGNLIFKKQFDILSQQYPEIKYKYFNEEFMKYNIHDIVKILELIKEYVFETKTVSGPNNCYEDITMRINNIKYPNGAMKGCIVIPEWPNTDEVENMVLLMHHVSDKVEISVPVKVEDLNKYFKGNVVSKYTTRLYEKAVAHVQINALIPDEKILYIEDDTNLPLNDITSNDGFSTSFDEFQLPGYDTNQFIMNDFHRIPLAQNKSQWQDGNDIDFHNPDLYIDKQNIDDPDVWENNPNKANVNYIDSHESLSVKYIGLYKYMEYLSKNDLWLRVGDAYMITGKNDDPDSNVKNLLSSLIIYNPNPYPIKVKYMIFS